MLQKLLRKKSGFTLIELMIVVVIIGVLASVAIPAFIRFVKRSKTSEATSLTKSLFEGATTYWNAINDTQGLTAVNTAASASTHCTALGDIDADSSKSTFELQVGRDSEGALYHGAGFYMVDELE